MCDSSCQYGVRRGRAVTSARELDGVRSEGDVQVYAELKFGATRLKFYEC
jgi:hypothetical protein